jgi:arsenite methyltransferase
MNKYFRQKVDTDKPELISVIDDLPLWSAPFGLKLLDTIVMKKNIRILDIGCGLGFPLIEIAERFGESCKIYGIDPWEKALERIRLKLKVYNIWNVEVLNGYAENMPFEDNIFDLVVSNNGINNVEDMKRTLEECYRVCKPYAQVTFTLNLEKTMIEFYNVFREVLEENNLFEVVPKMKAHIYSKRKPLKEIKKLLEESGFTIKKIFPDSFQLRYVDGTTMLNHYLIRYWFLDGWKQVVEEKDMVKIFEVVEFKLNKVAKKRGEFILTVPFVTIDCRK